jgi:hypothetical protein
LQASYRKFLVTTVSSGVVKYINQATEDGGWNNWASLGGAL